jgi:hypothetical protein
MSDERRRERGLTPMSGELESRAEWARPEDIGAAREPWKREQGARTTTSGMLVHGLKRLALLVGCISAILVAVSLLIVFLADTDPSRTFPLAFYFGGAAVAGWGFLSVLGAGYRPEPVPETGYEQVEKERWGDDILAYFGVGAVIVGLGVVLDVLL